MLLAFLFLFLFLVVVGFPVAFAIGSAISIAMLATGAPMGLLPVRLWSGLDKFVWVAIPLFILAGELMSTSGILSRLMDLARLLVGRLRGGLLHINIMVSMLFGGINGSGPADTSAIGSMLIPVTSKEYKDPPLAAAVTACSSIVGPIIPPSLPAILYALVTQSVTVSALFVAGIVPGFMLGAGMMAVTVIIAHKRQLPRDETAYTLRDVLRILARFLVAVILPIIMVGGVVSGVFTATESACVAVFYAIFAGTFLTRELTFAGVYNAVIHMVKLSGVVFLLVGMASVCIWWLSTQNLSGILTEFLQQTTDSPIVLLLIVAFTYLILSTVIDSSALFIMLVPVITPICLSYGLDPLHVGIVSVLSIMLGLLTPPVAVGLFIASSIARVSLGEVFVAAIPYLLVCIVTLLTITLLPETWMWLPRMLGQTE